MADAITSTSTTRRKFVRFAALILGGITPLPGLLTACQNSAPGVVHTGGFGFGEGAASFVFSEALLPVLQ